MSERTNIEWASHTASPWFGCSKVSLGCTNCYAEELTLKYGWAGWGDNSPRVRSKGFWKDAYKWNRGPFVCDTCGERFKQLTGRQKLCEPIPGDPCQNCNFGHYARPRMFTSLMDWLDPMVPTEWLMQFLRVIHDCTNLDWLLLTKRPELWRERVNKAHAYALATLGATGPESDFRNWLQAWFEDEIAPANLWLGTTVENQAMADKRIPELLKIPARVRWLSVEPLLSPIDFGAVPGGLVSPIYQNRRNKIDWVVVGGESGYSLRRRDCGVDAIVNVAEQCQTAGVPVFVKQDCATRPGQQGRIPAHIWALKQFPQSL